MLGSVIREQIGLSPDLSRRPRDPALLCHGGPYKTDAGASRGPTWYHIAGAWARTWAAFPQITLAATFIRTGVLTTEQVGQVLQVSDEVLLGGLTDLAARQRAVKAAGKWLHAEQDFGQ